MTNIEVMNKVVDDFAGEFSKNPFNFLYESDIQGLLFARLFNALQGDRQLTIRGGHWGDRTITTVPVKSEYPSAVGKFDVGKFDIALIDPTQIQHYDDKKAKHDKLKSDPFWGEPVQAALEVKYIQLGFSIRQYVAKIKQDLDKLRRYKPKSEFVGVSLVFFQMREQDLEETRKALGLTAKAQSITAAGIYCCLIASKEVYEKYLVP